MNLRIPSNPSDGYPTERPDDRGGDGETLDQTGRSSYATREERLRAALRSFSRNLTVLSP